MARVNKQCFSCENLEYTYKFGENVGSYGGSKFIFIHDFSKDPVDKMIWDRNRHGIAYIGKSRRCAIIKELFKSARIEEKNSFKMVGSKRERYNEDRKIEFDSNSQFAELNMNSRGKYLSYFSLTKRKSQDKTGSLNFVKKGLTMNKSRLHFENEIQISSINKKDGSVILNFNAPGKTSNVVLGGFYGQNGWWIDALGVIYKEYSRKQLFHKMKDWSACVCHLRTPKLLTLSYSEIKHKRKYEVKEIEIGGMMPETIRLQIDENELKGFQIDFYKNVEIGKEKSTVSTMIDHTTSFRTKTFVFDNNKMPFLKVSYDSGKHCITDISQEIPDDFFPRFNKKKNFEFELESLEKGVDSLNSKKNQSSRKIDFKLEKKKDSYYKFFEFYPFMLVDKIIYSINKKKQYIKGLAFEYKSFD